MKTEINRRKFIVGASCSLCGSLILPSCTQVPLTNRSQLNLYDNNLPIVIFQGSVGGIPIPKVYANEKSLNQEIDKVYDKIIEPNDISKVSKPYKPFREYYDESDEGSDWWMLVLADKLFDVKENNLIPSHALEILQKY